MITISYMDALRALRRNRDERMRKPSAYSDQEHEWDCRRIALFERGDFVELEQIARRHRVNEARGAARDSTAPFS